MRYLILIAFLNASIILNAQVLNPKSISVSYFGETIAHPGLKVGAVYELKGWEKIKIRKNGKEKTIKKSFDLTPSLGFYYHKNYQTGLFLIPEFSYKKIKPSGNSVAYGLGAGYLRTFIPNVYELNSINEVEKVNSGYNYFITNYFVAFGKDLNVKYKVPVEIYIKPQLMYALPNYANGVIYFALELGINYNL